MKLIFIDEAGTSAKEPVTVVVGIIADADEHVAKSERLVEEILLSFPERYRENFTFHAKSIFGEKKYQEGWMPNDRLNLLKDMMSVPRKIGMAICLCAVWRSHAEENDITRDKLLSVSQFQHFQAFLTCLAVADRNIRRFANPDELAAVVAEDVPEMRKFLRAAPRMLRKGFYLDQDMLRKTPTDIEAGYSTQSGVLMIKRIRNSINFVEKQDDLMVAVADACAFGWRRYFAGEEPGDDFADAILGDKTRLRNFAPPLGCECWWPHRI